MRITDEAVMAAINAYYHEFLPNECAADDMRRAIEAAIPHLPIVYEVKQLEWEYNERPNRTYQVSDHRGSIYYIDQGFGSDCYCFTTIRCGDGLVLYDGDDLPSAQHAAQADFERRVRECLVVNND